MKVTKQQIQELLSKSGPKRYSFFIKKIVDWEEVWGLYDDGWAASVTQEGQELFPLWPAREYAELCRSKDWQNCQAKSFTLDDLIDGLLPVLESKGILPSIFNTPDDQGVVITVEQLKADIDKELEQYY